MAYLSPVSSGRYSRERTADTDRSGPGHGLFVTGRTPSPGPKQDCYDENGMYSEKTEKPPKCAAYDPRTFALKQQTGVIVVELAQLLGKHRHHSQDVETMWQKADKLRESPEPPPISVMLYGATGTGKSSVTNSFAGQPDATKAGDTGQSCTAVPTKIVFKLAGQTTLYAADVRFYDKQKRVTFLSEHIKHFTRWHLDSHGDWPEEEKQEYQQRANAALKRFRALFCDQDEFSSEGNIVKYFKEHRNVAETIEDLDQWCMTLLSGCQDVEGCPTLRMSSDDLEQINTDVEPYMFEQYKLEEPELWPLVDHVCKGISTSPILRHIEVNDLPGTEDVDRVRAEVANEFIKECDILWAVAGMARAVSDASLDSKLATYGARFGSNVAIIATHSDVGANANLAKEMATKGAAPSSIARYEQLSKGINELKKDIKGRNNTGNKRSRSLQELETAEIERLDVLVDMRNSYLSKTLKEDKQVHLAPGVQLSVFCVSNTHYMAHKGVETNEKYHMSVEMTNIPALRRFALEVAAPNEFNTADEYINASLTLLRGAALWADAAMSERRQTLTEMAQHPATLLETSLSSWREAVDEECSRQLIQQLLKNRPNFVTAALEVVEKFTEHAWNTQGAFFRKHGRHAPRGKKHQILNEMFADKQSVFLNARWYPLLKHMKKELDATIDKVSDALDRIPAKLNNMPAATPIALEPLQGIINSSVDRIRSALRSRYEAFAKEASNIQLDATRDVPTSYFADAMRPLYTKCKRDSGGGVTDRRLHHLRNWLQGKSEQGATACPFSAVTRNLEKNFKTATDSFARDLQNDIKAVLEEMAGSFERAIREDTGNWREMLARTEIRRFVESKEQEMKDMERQLEAVKREYHHEGARY
ncbi:hypothetical protein CB0940_05566 [Cercospora beticola]|uniref:DUF7605 domain-containing protein n=1 Tax=Cercospora beticola TaxID=122368 RepID=A0A2G5HZK4_CERBT|nr:hypothetical protein CB0940_05566 [Cercospora beticola]PIA97976.1 hypothetical protein CB0940_05566 [Cercospora beticola]WPA98127.1 hypothetical protein RHO25_002738 [Cercospora beticola]